MTLWVPSTFLAAAFIAGGALYIHVRWRRSPQAYWAMIALAACYFVAGVTLGAWVMHLTTPKAGVSASVAPTPA